MQLVDSSTWQSCVGGMSSKPGETKLSLAGGTGAPTESWTLSVVGQNASSAVITCNANGIVCAFASDRVQGTSTTKYATTNKAFDIKVSTWTQGSFIGTAESVQALRTVAVPGQVDQQVVDGVTIVFVATAKLAPSRLRLGGRALRAVVSDRRPHCFANEAKVPFVDTEPHAPDPMRE